MFYIVEYIRQYLFVLKTNLTILLGFQYYFPCFMQSIDKTSEDMFEFRIPATILGNNVGRAV